MKKQTHIGKHIGYMAIDQYGQTWHIGNNPPRKWLMDTFGVKRAEKMYVDTKEGQAKHIGWIVAQHWLRVYAVCECLV